MSKLKNNIAVKYFRESKEELEKVSWPSRKDTTRYAIMVIVISVAFAIYFGALDWIFNRGLEALIKLSA